MTYVLPNYDLGVGSVSIWSIPPVVSDAFNCIGVPLDSLNHLPDFAAQPPDPGGCGLDLFI